jgi:NADH:ubiquinone oxidoreductase subunit 6 (subunit J)
MTIYTFYMVMFSGNEEGIKKAKWNLVGIFVALAVIWLAWLIVSFIFRWYQSNWEKNENNLSNSLPEMSLNYNNETLDNQIYLSI